MTHWQYCKGLDCHCVTTGKSLLGALDHPLLFVLHSLYGAGLVSLAQDGSCDRTRSLPVKKRAVRSATHLVVCSKHPLLPQE